MAAVSKNVYFDVLDDNVNEYNNTVQRPIQMKPTDVTSDSYAEYNEDFNKKDPKFKVGDHVRISKHKNIFAKACAPNWSKEVFIVRGIKNTVPCTYIVSDLNDEEITGSFYEKELQKTNQEKFRIDLRKPIDLMSVNLDQIVVSDKFKPSDEGFKYFIGYQEGEIVKLLCIILPQMSGYIKYFENAGKNMSFFIIDDEVWEKYKKIWDVIKNKLSIKFHSKPIYDQKYLKAKVREFDGVMKTNFLGNGAPKENMHYTCIACINIDSVVRIDKKTIRWFI